MSAVAVEAQTISPEGEQGRIQTYRAGWIELYEQEQVQNLHWIEDLYPDREPTSHQKAVGLRRIDRGRPVFYRSVNANAAALTRTISLYPGGPLGVSLAGQNMAVGIWDAGHALSSHPELVGRVSFGDRGPVDEHATHVAGTLIASGVQSRARGMAYEAKLLSYDWDSDDVEMLDAGSDGMLISNHSYGPTSGWEYGDFEDEGDGWYWTGDDRISSTEDYAFGMYDREAARWDRIVFETKTYLPVISAGNDRTDTGPLSGEYRRFDPATGGFRSATVETEPIPRDGGSNGFDSIAGAALAKNVLAVGSLDDLGLKGDLQISSFSSFGPSDDGRIKPDILANGDRLYSSSMEEASGYATYSGTSMSSPNTAGSLILLQQLNMERTGEPLWASTIRALVCHSATDIGPPGPDYSSGWGLLDVEAAAGRLLDRDGNPFAVVEDILPSSEPITLTLEKTSRGPLKLTLAWTDRPAEVATTAMLDDLTPVLVADLDIRLSNTFTGETYLPYVLDPQRPEADAGTGDNIVDAIEQIYLAEAPIGAYILQITRKGPSTGGDDIPFSLVSEGLADRERHITVGGFEATVQPSDVLLSWQAVSQSTSGWFILERARSSSGVPDAEPQFTRIDSVFATYPRTDSIPFELTDAGALPGLLTYRLLFRVGTALPTVEAGIDVDLALGTSEMAATVADGRVSLRSPIKDLRHLTTFEILRYPLKYDALGQLVLGQPFVVSETQEAGSQPLVTLNWSDQPPAGRYRYMLKGTYLQDYASTLATLDVQIDAPNQFSIRTIYPNPFSDVLWIDVDLPESGEVFFQILDTQGRVAQSRTLVEQAGRRLINLSLIDLPAGAYFVFLRAGEQSASKAAIHIR